MSSQDSNDSASGVRAAYMGGRPPKLSRDRIIAAARALPPEALTMKAVADALGVDRKSLNYYVCDRDGLLVLIAFDAFETEIARIDLSAAADWREMLRSYATAVATALIDVGVLIPYVQFGGQDVRFTGRAGARTVAVMEQIVGSLIAAGFDPVEAGRTMRVLAVVAHSASQEVLGAAQGLVDRRAGPVLRTLDTAPDSPFPALRRVVLSREEPIRIGEQFGFDLDLVITGLESKLRRRGGAN